MIHVIQDFDNNRDLDKNKQLISGENDIHSHPAFKWIS